MWFRTTLEPGKFSPNADECPFCVTHAIILTDKRQRSLSSWILPTWHDEWWERFSMTGRPIGSSRKVKKNFQPLLPVHSYKSTLTESHILLLLTRLHDFSSLSVYTSTVGALCSRMLFILVVFAAHDWKRMSTMYVERRLSSSSSHLSNRFYFAGFEQMDGGVLEM